MIHDNQCLKGLLISRSTHLWPINQLDVKSVIIHSQPNTIRQTDSPLQDKYLSGAFTILYLDQVLNAVEGE